MPSHLSPKWELMVSMTHARIFRTSFNRIPAKKRHRIMGFHKGADKKRRKSVIFFAQDETLQNSYHSKQHYRPIGLPHPEKVNQDLVVPFF